MITEEMIEEYRSWLEVDEDGALDLSELGRRPRSMKEGFLLSLAKYAILKEQSGPSILLDGGSESCGLCMFVKSNCGHCPIHLRDAYTGCSGSYWETYQSVATVEEAREVANNEYGYLLDLYEWAAHRADLETVEPFSFLRAVEPEYDCQ